MCSLTSPRAEHISGPENSRRRLLQQYPLENGLQQVSLSGPKSANKCTAANEDRWMVASGWAVAYRRYSLDYVADEDAAQRNIWSGDFDML